MELNEKQIAILKIAEEVISEKGFEAASIREISKRANINLAMISYYFGSKEKLVEALFINRSSEFKIKAETIVQDNTLSQLDKMLTLTNNYFEKVFNNFSFHKIMLKEMAYINSSIAYEQISKMKTTNFNIMDQVISIGIKNGEFNPQIGTDSLVSLVNGTLSNYALNEKYYRIRWSLDPQKSFESQTKEKIKSQLFQSLKAILLYHE